MHDDLSRAYYRRTRRAFLRDTTKGLGAAALASLLGPADLLGGVTSGPAGLPGGPGGALGNLHHAPKAKRVIYLFQAGAPSHLELFDYKPVLAERRGEDIPPSVRGNQRLSGMVAAQSSFPLVGSKFAFTRHAETGGYFSSLMPYTAQVAPELCVVQSMYTEAINHEPAVIFMQTGSQQVGRPSFGSWLSYGLGSTNENLPSFVVLLSKGVDDVQSLNRQAWGSGFLPSHHQGVQFRSGADPVLYLGNPDGISRADRRRELDVLAELDREQQAHWGDPEIDSKISQYEMAYRMQLSVPEITDLADEPESTFALYGEEARKPGTFAANCLLARRLAERDVPFVQLYHMGWDQHSNLPRDITDMAASSDRASAALVADLKQRGLLEDTLVVWGGEFGRTCFSQGRLTADNYGRDHHPRCFTVWLAGGGVKPGLVYGRTDDFGYNVVEDGVHVHDLQATMLHLLGVDHERLIFKHQGRRYRLTDVHGHVKHDLLA